jgi:hypothetical protein
MGIQVSPTLLKDLGFIVAEWVDSAFLAGTGSTVSKIARVLGAARVPESPLNWTYPFQQLYVGEDRVLWWRDTGSGKQVFLPQVVLLGPEDDLDEDTIRIELLEKDFHARTTIPAGLEYYRQTSADGRKQKLFDGEPRGWPTGGPPNGFSSSRVPRTSTTCGRTRR